jgi:hypothetical protein
MPTERTRKRLELIAERARELAKQVVRDVDPADTATDDEGEQTLQFDLELRADLRERDGNPATAIQQDET